MNIVIPTTFGGLNSRDHQAAMAIEDAIILDNMIASPGNLTSRFGYIKAASGAISDIETLLVYESANMKQLLSASGSYIYIGTSGPLKIIGSGFSNARWEGINYNGNLLLVNGVDTPQRFDGNKLIPMNISGKNLVATQINGAAIFKGFVFYHNSSSQDFWYGDLNNIEGKFHYFPLSRVGNFSGNLIKILSWNLDGGDGADDLLVFFTAGGDAIIYKGTDPSDAENWSLVGIFNIPSPISARGIIKIAGDIAIITERDFVFFSEIFKNGPVLTNQSKLSGALLKASGQHGDKFGWQLVSYPKKGLLIINIPLITNNKYQQYVINSINGAASRFTGINARCWAVMGEHLYFGANGNIYIAKDGASDDNKPIYIDIQQAYSTFSNPLVKFIHNFTLMHRAEGNININAEINYDFGQNSLAHTISSENTGTSWKSAPWGSSWSPEIKVRNYKYMSSGQGVYISLRLKAALIGQRLSLFSCVFNSS